MTMTIMLPGVPTIRVTEADLCRLVSFAEPVVWAVADACGVGLPVRLALGLGMKAVQHSQRS